MSKKLKLILLAVIVLISAAVAVYCLYLSPPKEFPSKEEITESMMNTFPEADIKEIQDIIFLDDRHAFVPFITKSDGYGFSFWEWDKHDWHFSSIDTGATPRIWKIDKKNPAENFIVWNFHPENDLKSLTFFLMKDRGYSVTDGKENYQPKIQMNFKVDMVGEKTYGFTKIPNQWQEYVSAENKLMSALIPNPLFSDFFPQAHYYYGWRSVTRDGSEDHPAYPINNNGFGTGDSLIEHIMFLDQQELY